MKTFRVAVAAAWSLLALATAPASAGGNYLASDVTREGRDALDWSAKLTCGTTEAGVTRYGMWEGRLYSRKPGEKDRHLFDVVGINTRQCERHEHPTRGPGFRSVSREIMVYLDPATGEILDRWTNPWTGESVEVVQVANDPVNMREPVFALQADGKPLGVTVAHYGSSVVTSREVPLFYENPLAGGYQEYVGGSYHAMEIFNTYYEAEDFLGRAPRARIQDSRISWQRISKWLPWMRMGDREGLMVFNAVGFSTFDAARIPPKLRAVLESRYPAYLTPPPLGDRRPNETTWTVTRKWIDDKRGR